MRRFSVVRRILIPLVAAVAAVTLPACARDGLLGPPGGDDGGANLDAPASGPDATGADATVLPDLATPIPTADLGMPLCGAIYTRLAGQHAEAPFVSTLDPPEGVTVEAWVYPTEAPRAEAVLVAHWNGNDTSGYWLGLTDGGLPIFTIGNGSFHDGMPHTQFVLGRNPLPVSFWTHLAGVVDTATGQIALFVNGSQVSVQPLQKPIAASPTAGLRVGDQPADPPALTPRTFFGYVTEVRVSHGARYVQDFPPAKRFADDPYTVALYHYAEIGKAIAVDSSHVHDDARLVGGAAMVAPPGCP